MLTTPPRRPPDGFVQVLQALDRGTITDSRVARHLIRLDLHDLYAWVTARPDALVDTKAEPC